MEIKRISKYSKIALLTSLEEINKLKVIQIVTENETAYFMVEYIPTEDIDKYITEQGAQKTKTEETTQQKTEEQKELETALDTMLNNDPLGKYTGCNLRVPFDRGDIEWVEWVLKNMHNKFIKEKVALIKGAGYGNFNN